MTIDVAILFSNYVVISSLPSVSNLSRSFMISCYHICFGLLYNMARSLTDEHSHQHAVA